MPAGPSSSAPDSPIRLIVGLGNPGADYAQTRHNVGFMILDRWVAKHRANFSMEKKWRGLVARSGDRVFLKPQTFMNLSGESAGAVARFFQIKPESVLVVYDDKDLTLGALRLRLGGSAGGHNGMKSLIQHLGTDQFPRLRFGIGAPGGGRGTVIGHVLGGFGVEERPELDKALDRSVEALDCALFSGFARAMNAYNRAETPPARPRPATAPKPPASPDPTPPVTDLP